MVVIDSKLVHHIGSARNCKKCPVVIVYFNFLEPGCNIRSSMRVDCFGDSATPNQKVPLVTPELCIQKGCCYDDMYMNEPTTWFYKNCGRTWCFKKKGAGNLLNSFQGRGPYLLLVGLGGVEILRCPKSEKVTKLEVMIILY